jgi:hypothetical protein
MIDGAPGPTREPQLAVDRNGNLSAVWIQYGGTCDSIWTATYR